MKRVLSVFLTVAMLLCLPVTTFAAEVEESQPSTCTVYTLNELKAALAAAADGDSIAIADCIEISDETVSSDKAVKIVRSNGFTDDMFVLGSSEHFVMFIVACGNAEITDCTFQTNGCLALSVPVPAAAVTVRNCTITDFTLPDGESAIANNGNLTLEQSKVYGNTGGIVNSGTLTVRASEIHGNGNSDITSRGQLNLAESSGDRLLYNAATGEQLSLPLSEYTDTATLLFLTEQEAADRFKPLQSLRQSQSQHRHPRRHQMTATMTMMIRRLCPAPLVPLAPLSASRSRLPLRPLLSAATLFLIPLVPWCCKAMVPVCCI